MKSMGIIFSNIYDSTLGELTNHRTVASLPFGGRYRQIDFILSNMSNSGIYNIGLITKYNYRSLMDHLGTTSEWDLNRKNEGLVILPPFASGHTGVYKGKLEALYTAIKFIDNPHYDYVVISDSTNICNIDFKKVIENHVESGADITVVANKVKNFNKEYPLVVKTGAKGKVNELLIDCQADENLLVGMGMFVLSRELLVKALYESHRKGLVHLERDFIQKAFNDKLLKVGVFKFDGIVLRNDSVSSYFENNMALLDSKVRAGIFLREQPIYTKIRDEIPSYYAEGSEVNDCLLADGCKIYGKVENSVLFRGVEVGEGAEIRSCIIMQGAKVGAGAKLEGVILDKGVTVSESAVLIGTPQHPVIVKKGETV